jgi:hypothetical protein
MFVCTAAVVAWLAAPASYAASPSGAASSPLNLNKAQWIWDKADTGETARYVCCLRRGFTLDEDPAAGAAVITADNNYELHVNGTLVGGDVGLADAHWNQMKRHDIGRFLRKGANVLAIVGINLGGPGGVAAAFQIQYGKDGERRLDFVTDSTWLMTAHPVAGFSHPELDTRGWKPAAVIGPMGCPPWGRVPPTSGAAAVPAVFDEPETRTLPEAEARAMLEAEWLYQAEGKPLRERALQEIGWAREMAGRLAARTPAPDLGRELAELRELEQPLNAELERAAGQAGQAGNDATRARESYLRVRDVKRRIMFKDPLVDFSQVVFIDVPERYPHESMHRVYPQAQLNCVRLLVLDGLHPSGTIRKLGGALGPGWHWRPEVSFDGKRVLYCFRPKSDTTFHLYETNVDGTGLRQITSGNYDDQDPIYLPDGRIAFMSNRGNSYARCTVGHPSTVLMRCDADGKNLYFLSAGNEPEYTPALMPDGRILYTRWEYTDKELMRIQSLWTVNPDGTRTSVFWGNQSYWPDLLMEARPIPGGTRVMFAAHGHHEVYWGGIGMLDQAKGLNYPHGLTKVTQELPWIEVGNGPAERMETSQYHTSGVYGGYKSPYPLSEELFLVSARQGPPTQVFATRNNASRFKLFLMDVYGNRELIYEGAYHILYAMPVKPRPVPPAIPDQVAWAGAQKDKAPIKPGRIYCADIYQGAPESLRAKAKFLRVISVDHVTFTLGKKIQDMEHPSGHPHMHVGPVMSVTVNDGVKHVLGTVPIEADGSVYFDAPPCKPLHFQLLDEQHRALQTMRSFTNVMPGETSGCTGCHEMHGVSPVSTRGTALSKPPAAITPYPWGAGYSFGYERDIQPILDKHCTACHQTDAKAKAAIDFTLRPSKDFGTFPEPYVTLTLGKKRSLAGDFPGPSEGGIADTILPEAHPWRPQDYGTLAPMTRLSYVSRLVELAGSGKHYEAKVDQLSLLKLIVWVDTLCPYRGEREIREMPDPDPNHAFFKRSNYPPSDTTVKDVYAESPYRPRMRTAPLVNRAYRQDEFPSVESRLPRDAQGTVVAPVSFTPDGQRIEHAGKQ